MLAACATTAPEPVAVPEPPVVQQRPSCIGGNFRDNVLALLASRYGEHPVAGGLASTGALVEVLPTPDGSTWTIIVSAPDGWACMVAAGQGWRNLKRATGTGT